MKFISSFLDFFTGFLISAYASSSSNLSKFSVEISLVTYGRYGAVYCLSAFQSTPSKKG